MKTRDDAAPGYLDRYRFYVRARIPRGHEAWAHRRASVGRFLGIYLLIEVCVWFVVAVVAIALTGSLGVLEGVLWVAGFFVLISPFSADHYSRKARRRLGF